MITRSPWGLVLGTLLQQALSLIFISRAAGEWHHLAGDRSEAVRLLKFGVEVGLSDWIWQLRTLVNPLLIAKTLGAEAAAIVAIGIRVTDIAGFMRHTFWCVYLGGLSRLRVEGRPLAPLWRTPWPPNCWQWGRHCWL
jgi:PST family polysaccharide transporter